jgi:hypothetical protein
MVGIVSPLKKPVKVPGIHINVFGENVVAIVGPILAPRDE